MSNEPLLLVGGSNIDFIATSRDNLIPHVSNIGTTNISYGGVMRNICENLARLGNNCTFISPIGHDEFGINLKNNLINLGVTIYNPKSEYPTGTYVAINDKNHDLAYGVCDNRIINSLTCEYIDSLKDIINKFDYIVLDTNLNESIIKYIVTNFSDKKFLIDPISPSKVIKVKDLLKFLYLIKCNIYEAKALLNINEDENLDYIDIVNKLLKLGIKNVVVSCGANDIYYGNSKEVGCVKVEHITNFVNTTGCGDALTSGIIDYFLSGHSLKESVIFGNKLSKLTLMVSSATSKEVSNYRH